MIVGEQQVAFSYVLTTGAHIIANVRLNFVERVVLLICVLFKAYITDDQKAARARHCCDSGK